MAESFHSLQSLSVSCFHVILGLPGPCFPSTCMSKAVLIAPLERSTCPYHRSLLSFRMRSRSSMPSRTSSSLDLVVTVSCGLTLQICLIIALSFRCRRWRFGFVNGQVSLAWSIALRTQELYTQPRVLKERWHEERTGSRSLNFSNVNSNVRFSYKNVSTSSDVETIEFYDSDDQIERQTLRTEAEIWCRNGFRYTTYRDNKVLFTTVRYENAYHKYEMKQ